MIHSWFTFLSPQHPRQAGSPLNSFFSRRSLELRWRRMISGATSCLIPGDDAGLSINLPN